MTGCWWRAGRCQQLFILLFRKRVNEKVLNQCMLFQSVTAPMHTHLHSPSDTHTHTGNVGVTKVGRLYEWEWLYHERRKEERQNKESVWVIHPFYSIIDISHDPREHVHVWVRGLSNRLGDCYTEISSWVTHFADLNMVCKRAITRKRQAD